MYPSAPSLIFEGNPAFLFLLFFLSFVQELTLRSIQEESLHSFAPFLFMAERNSAFTDSLSLLGRKKNLHSLAPYLF
jgi:hypothetical protein